MSLRTDFIANVSHELRTPLTSLVGFIDTLLGPAANDTEARERFLGIMRGQAARMSKLIERPAVAEPHRDAPARAPDRQVDLGALLREVARGPAELAGRRQPSSRSACAAEDEPVTVSGDRDELYEVFENLIDNAIKYGADGGTVDVTLSRQPAARGFGAIW